MTTIYLMYVVGQKITPVLGNWNSSGCCPLMPLVSSRDRKLTNFAHGHAVGIQGLVSCCGDTRLYVIYSFGRDSFLLRNAFESLS